MQHIGTYWESSLIMSPVPLTRIIGCLSLSPAQFSLSPSFQLTPLPHRLFVIRVDSVCSYFHVEGEPWRQFGWSASI